jgi:hypothetical protein
MKRWIVLNLTFTCVNLAVALGAATFLTYLYATLRGDIMPDGGSTIHVPRGYLVWLNFRAYLPAFMAVGSVLGVAVGQVQFLTWIRQQHQG